MPKSFRQDLEKIWNNATEAYKDKHITVVEFLLITADVTDGVGDLCRSVAGSDEDFEGLVKDSEWLAQTYIVPIKILPNKFLEALLDAQIVPLVRPTLTAIRHNIVSPTPPLPNQG
jgi:hypothetical protein